MAKPSARTPRRGFLDDDCGLNALQLAARGSTIIAELLRLSEHIPHVFVSPADTDDALLVSSFDYFNGPDAFEGRIQKSAELLEKDERFRSTHVDLLSRFFNLFNGIYGYATEVNRFIKDVRDGLYVSQTLESVLADVDGRQLLGEIIHLYGVMLLLLDHRIGGVTRERLIVSYIRYTGAGDAHTAAITNLCRDTGYRSDAVLPAGYPVAFFHRTPVDEEVVHMLITRIRSSDVYPMAYNYPAPEHRSAALALQGALVFVLLFFVPEVLDEADAVMREIVDRHFADNWVINYYMGFTADLVFSWNFFPAARSAIASTISLRNVVHHQQLMRASLLQSQESLAYILRQGALTEEDVLDSIHTSLLPLLRKANVSLRWFTLHATRGGRGSHYFARHAESYAAVRDGVTEDDLVAVLLQTAQLELHLRTMLTKFLKEKRARWRSARSAGAQQIRKLAVYYSGNDTLGDELGDTQLEEWFSDIATRIDKMTYGDPIVASRRLQKLIRALEEVEGFHQVGRHLHVTQLIQETVRLLHRMLRYLNMDDKVVSTLATVGDVSYAWDRMTTFGFLVRNVQLRLKQQPHLAVQIPALFAKLSSVLELPCNRIDQGAQKDKRFLMALESTSEYYSSSLVLFERRVLHVIPTSIFDVLQKIMHVLSFELRECPGKLARSELRDISQLEVREQLAVWTADIAKYASGILAMGSTRVGILEVQPRDLLETGVRRELVEQVTRELHSAIRFDKARPASSEVFGAELQHLGRRLRGIRDAFEYVQDFINVQGLRIWNEELTRIMHFTVEMECNAFVRRKMYPWDSRYQSETTPIPFFGRTHERAAYSFLGHMVQYLLALTDPTGALHLPAHGAWCSRDGHATTVDLCTFKQVRRSIGPSGLAALDTLLGLIVLKDVRLVAQAVQNTVRGHRDELRKVVEQLCPSAAAPQLQTWEAYDELQRLFQSDFSRTSEVIVRIGRVLLMRQLIADVLRVESKLNSGLLFSSLQAANQALLLRVYHHSRQPDAVPMPSEAIKMLSTFLEPVGLTDAAAVVYLTLSPPPEMYLYWLALIMRNASRMRFCQRRGCFVPAEERDLVDPQPFLVGLALLVRQCGCYQANLFEEHLAQAIRCRAQLPPQATPSSADARTTVPTAAALVHAMEVFLFVTQRSEKVLQQLVPLTLLSAE